MHHTPSYIELSGYDIKRHACKDQDMDHGMFNVLIGRLLQAEDHVFEVAWSRHYIESDCVVYESSPVPVIFNACD